MIPHRLPAFTLDKFPNHATERHSWLILQHRLRTELTSSAKLAVDGKHIQPGSLVFSLPQTPTKVTNT
jgi:hypothetical protein